MQVAEGHHAASEILEKVCLLSGHPGCRRSLSRANEARDYRIFETLGLWLIKKVRPMYAKESVPNVTFPDGRSSRLTQPQSRAASKWPNGLWASTQGVGSRCAQSLTFAEAYRNPSISLMADGTTATFWMCTNHTNGRSTRWTKHMWTSRPSTGCSGTRLTLSPGQRRR